MFKYLLREISGLLDSSAPPTTKPNKPSYPKNPPSENWITELESEQAKTS